MKEVEFLTGQYNVIGKNSRLKGDYSFQGDLYIMGQLEGSIEIDNNSTIVIDSKAKVIGQIFSGHLKIYGLFEGSIDTDGNVQVMTNAEVFGKIRSKELSCEVGSTVNAEILTQSSHQTAQE